MNGVLCHDLTDDYFYDMEMPDEVVICKYNFRPEHTIDRFLLEKVNECDLPQEQRNLLLVQEAYKEKIE